MLVHCFWNIKYILVEIIVYFNHFEVIHNIFGGKMRSAAWLLLLASTVLILQLHQHTARAFQFSVPGQWGGQAKRKSGGFSFSLPGQWGNTISKRSGDDKCEITDPVKLRQMFQLLQEEAVHIANCLQSAQISESGLQ